MATSPKITKRMKVKYVFSKAEQEKHGKDLANLVQRIAETENERKSVNKDYQAKIETMKAEVGQVSNFIANGFEYRDEDCEIKMNLPKTGQKTIIRISTGEKIDILKMTPEDMQEEMFDRQQQDSAASKKLDEKNGIKGRLGTGEEKIAGTIDGTGTGTDAPTKPTPPAKKEKKEKKPKK